MSIPDRGIPPQRRDDGDRLGYIGVRQLQRIGIRGCRDSATRNFGYAFVGAVRS